MVAHSGQTDHIKCLPILKCSFCMGLNLFQHYCSTCSNYVTLLPNDEELCKHMMSTVPFVWNLNCFQCYCSTCSNYVTLLPNNEELCKHNVYCSFCMELDLLHYIWCEILLEY